MADFYLDTVAMANGITPIQMGASSLRITALSTELSGSSEAMTRFMELYEEFRILLSDYVTLLICDLNNVQDAFGIFEMMDKYNGQLFFPGQTNRLPFDFSKRDPLYTYRPSSDPLGLLNPTQKSYP